MEQGKIMEAEVPTVRTGSTPTGLTAPPPPQPSKVFLQAGCPSCRPTNSVKALKQTVVKLNSSAILAMLKKFGLTLTVTLKLNEYPSLIHNQYAVVGTVPLIR